ncbi:hypothetical protein HanXRQr2_Chr03g0092301 [Helianthus annuus]|uniref:Uncharacterized protein n=1 Tax=Helianthus annuus TaxID=4232 RepID=A0A9K3JEJ0_HELAN|nr:hypothetical protein HanXRQr2_Chr03g0092301 [Helianthus annuus]KAJ0942170.1 hypothetical protein HanPSC8_Chr03g0088731 [Helianthus annuus]
MFQPTTDNPPSLAFCSVTGETTDRRSFFLSDGSFQVDDATRIRRREREKERE